MPPRKARLYTLITRPRISLGVMSCTSELTIENTPIIAAPEMTRSAPLNTIDLETANPAMALPSSSSVSSAICPLFVTLPRAATTRGFLPVGRFAGLRGALAAGLAANVQRVDFGDLDLEQF